MVAKTAFVTGAGGFIGKYLVKGLLAEEYQVTALMLPGEPVPQEWRGRVKLVEGDIRRLESLLHDIGAFDVLFHLAAVVSDWGAREEHVDITVKGTEQAISLALKNDAHFIVTTSVCAYADALAKGEIDECTALGTPTSHYEFCKQEQERVTHEAIAANNLKATIVRPGNVFGVGSVPWVNTPLEYMRQRKPIMLGKGDWDAGLVHAGNLVQLMLLIAESTYYNGEVFLGADGFGVTWKQYWHRLAEAAGTPKPTSIPNMAGRWLAPVFEMVGQIIKQKERPLITRQVYRLTGGANIFSTRKSSRLLGYQPKVSFDQAMEELAESFRVSK